MKMSFSGVLTWIVLICFSSCSVPYSSLQPAGSTFLAGGENYMFARSSDSIEVQCGLVEATSSSALFRLLYFNHSDHEIWLDPSKIQLTCLDTVKGRATTRTAYDPEVKLAEIDQTIAPYRRANVLPPKWLQNQQDFWQQQSIRKTIVFAGEEKYGNVFFDYTNGPNRCLLLVPTPSDTIAFPFSQLVIK